MLLRNLDSGLVTLSIKDFCLLCKIFSVSTENLYLVINTDLSIIEYILYVLQIPHRHIHLNKLQIIWINWNLLDKNVLIMQEINLVDERLSYTVLCKWAVSRITDETNWNSHLSILIRHPYCSVSDLHWLSLLLQQVNLKQSKNGFITIWFHWCHVRVDMAYFWFSLYRNIRKMNSRTY